MKKLLLTLLLIVSGILLLIGCSINNNTRSDIYNQDEPTDPSDNPSFEVTELSFTYAGGDPLVKELISERVQKFNASQSQFKIIENTGSGAYLDYLKTQDATGEFPDMLDSRNTHIWVGADKIAELPASIVDLLDNPPALNEKYYVAPLSISLPSHGIYYNKALFDELGLSEPTTYDEFEDLCDVILEAGISPIVQGGKDIWHMGFWWSHFWNEAISSENEDWIAHKKAGLTSFTDDNIQDFLNHYAALYNKGYIDENWLNTSDNQLVSYLLSEKAAMFYSGSWMINQVAEADPNFELGWFPVPDSEGHISLIYASNLAGFALSKEASTHPNKVAGFEAFLKFWYEEDMYIPFLVGIVAGPATEIQGTIEYGSPFTEEFSVALEESVYTSSFWNSRWGDNTLPGGFRDASYRAFQEMILNQTTALELGQYFDELWESEITDNE